MYMYIHIFFGGTFGAYWMQLVRLIASCNNIFFCSCCTILVYMYIYICITVYLVEYIYTYIYIYIYIYMLLLNAMHCVTFY